METSAVGGNACNGANGNLNMDKNELDKIIDFILFGDIHEAPWSNVPEIDQDKIPNDDIEAHTRVSNRSIFKSRRMEKTHYSFRKHYAKG